MTSGEVRLSRPLRVITELRREQDDQHEIRLSDSPAALRLQ